jgi:hypothetical protein
LYLNAGNSKTYNNTFSNNTGTTTAGVIGDPNNVVNENAVFVYNTLYNSGSMTISGAGTTVAGNIMVYGTNNALTSGTPTARNIISAGSGVINYCETGLGVTTNITTQFSNIFDINLNLADNRAGKQYHPIINMNSGFFDIARGLPFSNYLSPAPGETDQLGNARTSPYVLGAIDRMFTVRIVPSVIFKRQGALIITPPKEIPLSDYITNRPIPGAVTYGTSGVIPGTASVIIQTATGLTTITPEPSAMPGHYSHPFTVNLGGYMASGTIEIHIVDEESYSGFPGLIDPFDPAYSSTCYDYMGAVAFTSSIRFMTNFNGAAPTSVWPGAYRINGSSGSDYRVYGFQTPLVADFDNDGYPEIVALGRYGTSDTQGHIRYIDIYDGRTGQIKVRHTAHTSDVSIAGSHPSPGLMAIIDSDRNGTKEIFVAWPGSGSTDANNLVKYEVLPGSPWSLARQWGVQYYTTGNARYPVVQVVDFDCDGTAEILVYNKIYDAASGALKVTLETLAPAATTITSGAFTGRNSYNITGEDHAVAFAYVYDIDLDGRYEMIAGDKVYYDIRPTTGTYKVLQRAASDIRDGRTGVADMDGDGIPDIVVARRSNGSTVTLSVWNPGFLSLDGSGNVIKNYTPDADGRNATVASSFSPYSVSPDKTISVEAQGAGTNSYIYIGDIDGKAQNIGGKDYYLPEVAILSGVITYDLRVNHHPNVMAESLIPNGGTSPAYPVGVLAAFTVDLADSKKLKMSFVMEHEDRSVNTGFSMFDFDNDGVQEICYRDELNLRIIKANKSFVPYTEGVGSTILFSVPCYSYTGFEGTIIADIDGDNSAEMVVVGKNDGSSGDYYGFIYAVGNGSGAKFAPALNVWNQLLFDPFKIDPDSVTTRWGLAPNRLDPKYDFVRQIKNTAGQVISERVGYKPFNGTMIQATKIDEQALPHYEPIVFLTEAYIISDVTSIKRPKIVSSGTNHYIELTIGNKSSSKTSVLSNIPIAIYTKNTISEATYSAALSKTLATVYSQGTTTELGPTFSLAPGQEKTVWIPIGTGAIPGAGDAIVSEVYIVRLGDASGGSPWVWSFGYNGGDKYGTTYPCPDFDEGLGPAASTYRDCDWCDQVVRAARYQTLNDLYTIQEFTSVTMNVMGNDILPVVPKPPDTFSFMDTVRLMPWNIVPGSGPIAGFLTFNGVAGAGARITYHHDDRALLPAGIDSFQYRLTYWDAESNANVTKTSSVYIYVMKSLTGGFSACYDKTTRIELHNAAPGITFEWHRTQYDNILIQPNSRLRITGEMKADSTYWLKPITSTISMTPSAGLTTAQLNYYRTLNFPRGELKIKLVTYTPGSTALMRWTGHVDRKWKNPQNWVEVRTVNGKEVESPVTYPPSECANVIIPANVNNFPEMTTDTVVCNDIAMKDRAMLKNPHVLKYRNASVEIKLKPKEMDRYVMWSAPLMSMYSGDYHYRDASGPRWGDVFASMYQRANPDPIGGGSVAETYKFTASFAYTGQPLPLGQAINVKVISNNVTRDSMLRFPRVETAYTSPPPPLGSGSASGLSRTNSTKFITHGQNLDASGRFTMPVYGDIIPGEIIQVLNPYLAYLNVDSFITRNNASGVKFQSGYYMWNGEVGADVIAVNFTNGNRMTVVGPVDLQPQAYGYIPPLQAFFLIKQTTTTNIPNVLMSPNWTVTVPVTSYTLRADSMVKSGGVMNMTLSNGSKTAYAAMLYTKGSTAFMDKEDMPVVMSTVDGQTSLALYTMSANNIPLMINSNEHFDMAAVPLGFAVQTAGEYRLTFSSLHSFGFNVVLVDKMQGHKQIDLNKTPEYTFTVSNPGAPTNHIEINNRFELRFSYTGHGVVITGQENTAPPSQALHVSSGRGYMQVWSDDQIGTLQVYDALGKLVYSSSNVGDKQLRIPVPGRQMYVVKAQIGGEMRIEKTIVK